MGDVLYLTGRPSEAERHYRQAVQIREKLSEDFPADTEHRRRLSLEYADLGLALFALKRTQEAEVIFRRRLSVAKKLVADHPTAAHLVPELAWAYYDLGFLRELTGRFQEAADSFRPAFKAFEDAVVQSPKDGRNHFNLAWVLATCPAPQFRHPGRAVEFANKALQLEPMPAEYWRTLGVAEYRAGNWKAALQAFDESTARAYGRERGELFFLAMTHWQLGDKSRASRLYEQARRWMEGNRPGDMQARSFRDEAAAVLGLENKKN